MNTNIPENIYLDLQGKNAIFDSYRGFTIACYSKQFQIWKDKKCFGTYVI